MRTLRIRAAKAMACLGRCSTIFSYIDKQKALRRDCIYNIENTDLEIGGFKSDQSEVVHLYIKNEPVHVISNNVTF